MPFPSKFATLVFCALSYVESARAVPSPISFTISEHATHGIRNLANNTLIKAYHPPSNFETFGAGIPHPAGRRDTFNLEEAAKSFLASHHNIDPSSVKYHSGYSGDVSHHGFLKQVHNGIPFSNAVANIVFNKDEKVASIGSSFVNLSSIAPSTPTVSLEDAVANAEAAMGGKHNGQTPSLEYFAKEDNTAVLTHVIQIQNKETNTWGEAFIDAHTNELVSVIDFVAKASYRVIPIDKLSPQDGFQVLVDPADRLSSPFGWHATSAGDTNSTTTSGNNAYAWKTDPDSYTNQSSATDNFIFVQNPKANPTDQVNLDAARTNTFYVVNSVHDIAYRYGFTEAAFNFQTNNNGKGGSGNDPVSISVQDSNEINNAFFSTPADGRSGEMTMHLFDLSNPFRDGSFQNDLVIHEMTHGITNRMTGGGTARCLQTVESSGLGEGWSDAMADLLSKTSAAVPDFVFMAYVFNNSNGTRRFPYSTNNKTNALTYANLSNMREEHGHVYNRYRRGLGGNPSYRVCPARRELGWSANLRTNPTTREECNFPPPILDALAIQPCNPTFLSARDAWIQADANRYGGANKCTLWKPFASRGLGQNATPFKDDRSVPAGC